MNAVIKETQVAVATKSGKSSMSVLRVKEQTAKGKEGLCFTFEYTNKGREALCFANVPQER